jgi:hypothetical protein
MNPIAAAQMAKNAASAMATSLLRPPTGRKEIKQLHDLT